MIIAQITDLHVVAPGQRLDGVIDTNSMAEAAISHLNGLAPRPDLVLGTGDLVDNGEPSEYMRLREIFDDLEIPYYLIPGNHDRRAPLLEFFAGHLESGPSGFIQYTIEGHPVRLVALDTLNEGTEDGLLCNERLAWLDETLRQAPDRPTLIFMHHPPFETGIWWMDTSGLSGASDLRELIARHPQVARIVCGHIHRPIQVGWGGTLVSIAPSTAHQVHLDLVPENKPYFILEPPACQLHFFDGRDLITHTTYVNWPQKPIDLTQFMEDWEAVKAEWRARKAALR